MKGTKVVPVELMQTDQTVDGSYRLGTINGTPVIVNGNKIEVMKPDVCKVVLDNAQSVNAQYLLPPKPAHDSEQSVEDWQKNKITVGYKDPTPVVRAG